jgi:phage-related protein
MMKDIVAFLKPITEWISHNQKLATIIALVVVGILAAVVAFIAIGKTITTLTSAWTTWGKAISAVNKLAMENPWALVIMAVIIVIILIITHWKELKKWGEEAWKGIEKAWSAAGKFFDKLWQDVIGFFRKHWKVMLEIILFPVAPIIALWLMFPKFFDGLWKDVIGVFNAVKNFIVDFFKAEWDAVIAIWNALGSFFTGVWNGLKRAIGVFAGFIKQFFVNEWNGLVSIWNGVTGFFSGLWDGIGSTMGKVVGILKAPFKEAFNGISHLWNDTIGKLSFKAPSWVPGIGGKGFDMPKLPYLEAGTEWFGGGSVVVGERGPERVVLPQGSQVIPNAVASHAGGMGNSPMIGTLQVNIKGGVFMGNQAEAQMLAKQVYQSLQQIARQHGLQGNIPNIGILPV